MSLSGKGGFKQLLVQNHTEVLFLTMNLSQGLSAVSGADALSRELNDSWSVPWPTMSKLFKKPSCSTDTSLRVELTNTAQNEEVIDFLKCTEENTRGRGRAQQGASPPGYVQVLTTRREILDYPSNHLWVGDLTDRQGGVNAVCAILQLKIIWYFITVFADTVKLYHTLYIHFHLTSKTAFTK